MKTVRRILVSFFVLLLAIVGVAGEEPNYILEKDLTQHFYYYDLLDHSLLPEIKENDKQNIRCVVLFEEEMLQKKLKFRFPENLRVFVDGRLVSSYLGGEDVLLSLDDLRLDEKEKHIFLFYTERSLDNQRLQLWLIDDSNNALVKTKQDFNQGVMRFLGKDNTGLFVVLLMTLAILAYLRFIHSPYLLSYFDVTKYFSRVGIEDFIILNPFTRHSLLLMFLMSLFYAIALVNYDMRMVSVFGFGSVLNIVFTGVIVFALVLLKYMYLVFFEYYHGR